MKGRTYRYMEREAQYPFGYGLTYGNVRVTAASAEETDHGLVITAEAENFGTAAVKDVVQVYVKNLHSRFAVRNYSLAGFLKTELQPGEKKTVKIPVSEAAFLVVDEEGQRIKDGDEFELFVGCSQPDKRSCELTGNPVISIKIKR